VNKDEHDVASPVGEPAVILAKAGTASPLGVDVSRLDRGPDTGRGFGYDDKRDAGMTNDPPAQRLRYKYERNDRGNKENARFDIVDFGHDQGNTGVIMAYNVPILFAMRIVDALNATVPIPPSQPEEILG
jgi:hypothetical protein